MKIIEKSGYQALPWVRYITQNGGKHNHYIMIMIMIITVNAECVRGALMMVWDSIITQQGIFIAPVIKSKVNVIK